MNDRQLAYVVAAVEEGSFTQAAVRCRVSQPSLSAAIARLERDLGVALFHRVGRRVIPTDACRSLLPAARDVIRGSRAVLDSIDRTRNTFSGHLDLAVQATVIGAVVGLLADYRARCPGVTLRVRSPGGDSVTMLVASGQAELGIGDMVGPGGANLIRHDLWTESYVCVDRADGTAAGDPCDANRLASVPVIATPSGSATRDVLDSWFAAAGASPSIVVEVDHREALLPLVAAGCGAALVPRSMAIDAGGSDSLQVRPLVPAVERRTGIVHRRAPLTPAAARLLDVAIERYHDHGKGDTAAPGEPR